MDSKMKALQINYSLSPEKRTNQLLLSGCCLFAGIIAAGFAYTAHAAGFLILTVIYILFCAVFLMGQLLAGYKKYIWLNNDSIEEKLSYWSVPQKISWDEVKKTTLGTTHVNLEINSGKTRKIDLTATPYEDLKNIKHYFFAFCLEKKIPCYIKAIKKETD